MNPVSELHAKVRVIDLKKQYSDTSVLNGITLNAYKGQVLTLIGSSGSGKSTLFNALVESEAAIVTPIAGTTRDVLHHSVALSGVPFRFADTAGLREAAEDPVLRLAAVERERDYRDGYRGVLGFAGPDLLLQVDIDGNGTVDMEVVMQGLAGQTLTSADFML